jgi:phage gpG-like protein
VGEGPGWAPLAVKRRGSAHPILQRSGQLAASITSSHGRDFAAITAPPVIAIAAAFGALQRR